MTREPVAASGITLGVLERVAGTMASAAFFGGFCGEFYARARLLDRTQYREGWAFWFACVVLLVWVIYGLESAVFGALGGS